ncbi:MAG: H/ACA RNA-protein complex protein Gar1 [Methanophagales archaeon ANME-1-THS]|nr:MAG: H/ACA RNA-protein complex protein Gar1 [Methanophagales archaeon ANME-1-THS]
MRKRPGKKGLGTVLHLVDNQLIVRAGRLSVERMINAMVMTADKRKIGKIYDIFGPVDHPYVSVRPLGNLKEEELKKLVHTKLYVL